jgi:hypothetical protein
MHLCRSIHNPEKPFLHQNRIISICGPAIALAFSFAFQSGFCDNLKIMEKDFDKEKILKWFKGWAELKPKLHFSEREIYFKERQIWWASVGQNIGSEENGKHGNFERTVLIFKKFNKDTFLGMPISTKIKIGL